MPEECSGRKNRDAEFLDPNKIAPIVRDDKLRTSLHREFQDEIITRVREKRSPQVENGPCVSVPNRSVALKGGKSVKIDLIRSIFRRCGLPERQSTNPRFTRLTANRTRTLAAR